MNIQPEVFLSEVLFRFGPDGLLGAHAKDSQQLIDMDAAADSPDRVISEKEMDPRAITVDEAEALIGAKNTQLVSEVGALRDASAQLSGQVGELSTQIAGLTKERDALLAQIQQIRDIISL